MAREQYISPTIERAVRAYIRDADEMPTADQVVTGLIERFPGNERLITASAAFWTRCALCRSEAEYACVRCGSAICDQHTNQNTAACTQCHRHVLAEQVD